MDVITSGSARAGHRPVALASVLAVLFLTFLDTTIVSVTLGNIQYDLGAGVIPLQWVVNAYSLVFASLMLVAGSLSDRFGRRSVMVAGIAVFCGGSLLCALAPNVGWVIAGRAVMGVGAAASEPGTLSVIRQLYPERGERARALGAWAAVSGLSLALGPVIGGALIDLGDWRDVFWFNLVLGVLLLAATARFVPNSSDPGAGRPDAAGFVLGALCMGSVIYAGISGEQFGYGTGWIVALFVVGGLSLIGFVIVEKRAPDPMLDLRYLRDRAVSSALVVAFVAYFGVFSIFFLATLYLDVMVGYSGARSVALFAPMAAAIVIGSLVSGRWVAHVGAKAPMITGCGLSAAAIFATSYLLTAQPSFTGLLAGYAVAGLGFGIVVVPITSAVLGNVAPARSGMAASATNTARQLGSVVGVAALGAIVNSYITHDFGDTLRAQSQTQGGADFIIELIERGGTAARGIDLAHPPPLIADIVASAAEAFRSGLHVALRVSAVLIVLAAVVCALVPRRAFDREAAAADEPAAAPSG
jgi:EmrB/QacA subfamily drug resistance transporter